MKFSDIEVGNWERESQRNGVGNGNNEGTYPISWKEEYSAGRWALTT